MLSEGRIIQREKEGMRLFTSLDGSLSLVSYCSSLALGPPCSKDGLPVRMQTCQWAR